MISLEISTSDMVLPIQKAYQPGTTVADLRNKLELVVGGPAKTMKLYAGNSFIADLENDDKSLQEFIPNDSSGPFKLVVHVSDECKITAQGEDVEKFEITDEQYEARSDSVRKFLQDKRKEGSIGGGDGTNVPPVISIEVGSRCEIHVTGKPRRRGVVKFVGNTQFKPGAWVGVELDEPTGNNDGSVDGTKYFECKPKYGSFVRPKDVVCGDFPVEGEGELDEL